jgi:hypothetical protein
MSNTDTVSAEELLIHTGLNRFVKVENVSDNFHTFADLYKHRNVLFCVLLDVLTAENYKLHCWKSKKHADGTMFEGDNGWFIAGIGDSITYHMPITPYWDLLDIEELETAPEWNGYTSDDVLENLIGLIC